MDRARAVVSGCRSAGPVIAKLFEAVDADGSGAVDFAELTAYTVGIFSGAMHDPLAKAMLRDFGVDGSRRSLKRLEALFRHADTGGDGCVTPHEFSVLLVAYASVDEARAQQQEASRQFRNGLILGLVTAAAAGTGAWFLRAALADME